MVSTCDICKRSFEILRGFRIHGSSCEKRERVIINRLNVEHQNNENANINHHIESNMIVNMNEIRIERNNNIEVTLPSYEPDLLPTKKWHDYTAQQFVNLINSTYDDIIHCRKNSFKLPNGKASRLFIK